MPVPLLKISVTQHYVVGCATAQVKENFFFAPATGHGSVGFLLRLEILPSEGEIALCFDRKFICSKEAMNLLGKIGILCNRPPMQSYIYCLQNRAWNSEVEFGKCFMINLHPLWVLCRVFKFSRHPVQITSYFRHLPWVLFVFRFY